MFSTKNAGTLKVGPVISPGNHVVKLNSITFETPAYDSEAINVVLNVETKPVGGDFEGFLKDVNNPNGPRYEGQVGRVKYSAYAFKDAVLPSNGKKIYRDAMLINAISNIADVLGKKEEMDSINASTLQEFEKAANKILGDSEYFNLCIGGREWENKEGYINVDLSLPKFTKTNVPMEKLDQENSRLYTFNYDTHVRKLEKKTTNNSNESNFEPAAVDDNDEFDL